MNVATIKANLSDARSAFLKKDFKSSLESAELALKYATAENSFLNIITAKIFIAKINAIKGHYIGDAQHFTNALEILESIDNQLLNGKNQLEFYLVRSDLYLNTNDLDQADHFASLAFEYAKKGDEVLSKIHSLIAVSEVLIKKNKFGEAQELANKALTLANENNDRVSKAGIFNLISKIYIKRQNYDKILSFCQEVLEVSQLTGDVEQEIIASSNLGIYYAARLDYKSAIPYFFSSLEKSEAIQFDRQTAQNLINLGTIYARLFNPKEALSKYEAVVEKYDRVLASTTKTILYNNIGNIYFEEKSLDQSKKYFQRTLDLAVKTHYTEMVALALAHLAKISCEQNRYDEAATFADRANELLEDMGDLNAKSINLLNFAKLAYHSGDFETAILHLKAGVETSKKVRNEENEIACYQLLSEFFQEKNEFKNAFHFKNLYAEKQEDYLKKQRNRQILDQEIKFVTKEKEQQIDALKKENQLQAMLLEKQEEVERANKQLTQANEELKQFAYVASHDLKEPLRMIGSYTQIINKKFGKDINEDEQSYFNYVTDGVDRMNNLLDGLLKYATVGRGEQILKPVNLNDSMIICQSNLRLLIAENQAEIISEELPTVNGIPSLISQLFQNLISNALKFQKENNTPKIIISSEEKKDEYIISVKDNGIGIKPEYKDRIFVIFQRLHARTEYEGTGIGLALCYKIMQRMGGKIWVESELGEGATFYFNFPKN